MGRKRLLLVVLVGLVLIVLLSLRKERRSALGRGWPVNLAHRGASARAPENTLEAFRLAVESGAGGLELDVHLTRDGHVVVIHDPTLDRTTNRTGAVSEMTLDELREPDAGHNFSPDGSTLPYRGLNLRIPTLVEVLREFPGVAVNIDMKADRPGIESAVLDVLREADAEGRALVVSSRYGAVRLFRRISGGRVSTGASRWETGIFYLFSNLRLERFLRPAYDALQVPPRHRGIPLVTRRFVEAAHDSNVRVDAWTINETGEMCRLLDLGVDVIMTDRPETLADVLERRVRSTASSQPSAFSDQQEQKAES
ncbi:MAG: glycerophosphodiester phosphodiesterase [Rubrobacteraceae bacterium]